MLSIKYTNVVESISKFIWSFGVGCLSVSLSFCFGKLLQQKQEYLEYELSKDPTGGYFSEVAVNYAYRPAMHKIDPWFYAAEYVQFGAANLKVALCFFSK